MTMDRPTILTLWNGAWEHGLGFAPWNTVLSGLTLAQASWTPANDRLSIWAHVSHICFWREYIAAAARKQAVPSDEVVKLRNFESPCSPLEATDAAWAALEKRFADSHALVAGVYADPTCDHDWMWGLVAHDSYHVGQIMLLRALQGLKPLM
jgi:hypothetical protein